MSLVILCVAYFCILDNPISPLLRWRARSIERTRLFFLEIFIKIEIRCVSDIHYGFCDNGDVFFIQFKKIWKQKEKYTYSRLIQ